MHEGQDPGPLDEPIDIRHPKRESGGFQRCRERARGVLARVHGHVDIGGQPRCAVENRGLRSEEIPAKAKAGEDAAQRREQLSER
jgi:hypothetical protein